MPSAFRITLLLSVGLHMACFGIFEPTFGSPLTKLNFTQISFLGSILEQSDLSASLNYGRITEKTMLNLKNFLELDQGQQKKEKGRLLVLKSPYLKPLAALGSARGKISFLAPLELRELARRENEPTVIFHPPLPYSFLLYFQDRQTAHMEFSFAVSETGKVKAIKRKISSGNLDTDLLALRYIAHYLNLAEGQFLPVNWQTVKIDLTRKDDQD